MVILQYKRKKLKEKRKRDFAGGPGVKNPPCDTRDMGSVPGQGTKIPHAAEQLSLQVITTEPTPHN